MLILGIVAWFVCGGICAVLAAGKGRNVLAWLLIGGLFSVLGVVLIVLQPPIDASATSTRSQDAFDQLREKYGAVHAARQPVSQQLAELTREYEAKKARLLSQLRRS